MATLYVRDVPERLYKRLRARARRNGRSVNSEAIEILDDVLGRQQRSTQVTDRLRELAREIQLPPEAPRPEDIIRELRDGSARDL